MPVFPMASVYTYVIVVLIVMGQALKLELILFPKMVFLELQTQQEMGSSANSSRNCPSHAIAYPIPEGTLDSNVAEADFLSLQK